MLMLIRAVVHAQFINVSSYNVFIVDYEPHAVSDITWGYLVCLKVYCCLFFLYLSIRSLLSQASFGGFEGRLITCTHIWGEG